MLEDLLPYYNQELGYIRELAGEFAKIYPKVAGHLNISAGKIEDPDLARMIESFAFLTAQVRYKLEDDFPEVAESLLSVLHPYYLAPIPAFSIIQFKPQPELATCYTIPKDAVLETGSAYEEACNFSTLYPVELWPIKVALAEANDQPFKAPLREDDRSKAVVRLVINYLSPKVKFSEIAPGSLTFFLNASEQVVYRLYTLLFQHTISIALASSATDEKAIFINKCNIKPVGFNPEESLLPYNAQLAQGYGLLTEYFAFPEKFLFFELSGLDAINLQNIDNRLEIFFYLDDSCKEILNHINSKVFNLGCTPIVNLFRKIPEPIHLTQMKPEYKIIPDSRHSASSLEIHSVKNVSMLNGQGKEVVLYPFYGIKHHTDPSNDHYFWHIKRKAKSAEISEVYISFTDFDYKNADSSEGIIHIEALCTNGDIPSYLPIGNNEPYLQLSSKGTPIAKIECLIPFSSTIRPKLRDGVRWKLISHLSLNYFSLAQGDKGTDILKEILRLYNFKDSADTHAIIDSILSVQCRRTSARGPIGSRNAICQGMEITIKLENTGFVGNGLFLFGSILDRFFARYATMNSFTKLILSTVRDGVLYQWPPRAGNKALL